MTPADQKLATAQPVLRQHGGSPGPGPAISLGELRKRRLNLGSDVEVARAIGADLQRDYGKVVYAEGKVYLYREPQWVPVADHELRRCVHRYDGVDLGKSTARLKLNKQRVNSILHEMEAMYADPLFFANPPSGINCASGFIVFGPGAEPTLRKHDRDDRCRHTLEARWDPDWESEPPPGSKLETLLGGVFKGDVDAAEKRLMLGEVCASAALGYATKLRSPKAVILYGQTAGNGKSQVIDLVRGLLPPTAVCSIPPARMGDDKHLAGLPGMLLNATDEMSGDEIASDRFKTVVTGETVQARDVYKSRIEFRPIAQHLIATNCLPPFRGGFDNGVSRRLLVITFNRTIPVTERVENFGRRVAVEEADLLLAWVVAAAHRLIQNRDFTVPPSAEIALREWLFQADPVAAWLHYCVAVDPKSATTTRIAYVAFSEWGRAEGCSGLPTIGSFVQRVQTLSPAIKYGRRADRRLLVGMSLLPPEH